MKSKSSQVVSSLIALGFAVGSVPAFAGQAASDQSADEKFKKAVEAQKEKERVKPGTSEVSQMYSTYALGLLSSSTDTKLSPKTRNELQERAQKILKEGRDYAKKAPAASLDRLYYGLRMVEGYRMAKMAEEERIQTEAYDKELKQLEADANLGRSDYLNVAMMLLRMGQLYVPSPAFRAARMMPTMQIMADNGVAKPGTVKQKDYKAAEEYQLRALALYNRLPESDPTRINAQRNMVAWYHLYGQAEKEKQQTKLLSNLLHSTDPNVLFPPAPPCPACGMG